MDKPTEQKVRQAIEILRTRGKLKGDLEKELTLLKPSEELVKAMRTQPKAALATALLREMLTSEMAPMVVELMRQREKGTDPPKVFGGIGTVQGEVYERYVFNDTGIHLLTYALEAKKKPKAGQAPLSDTPVTIEEFFIHADEPLSLYEEIEFYVRSKALDITKERRRKPRMDHPPKK